MNMGIFCVFSYEDVENYLQYLVSRVMVCFAVHSSSDYFDLKQKLIFFLFLSLLAATVRYRPFILHLKCCLLLLNCSF